RARLEQLRHARSDPGLHSLGAIWRRARLTCMSREQLGSFLLDVLEADTAGYIRFHVEVAECPFCRANLADLQARSQPATTFESERRRRIFHSSRGLLSSNE
ncbi:MAG: hypothetical protein K2X91_06015, partial [Thermoleophilia bacterium]|nr:hypothetical protein [Thermoleophilia bacterium]